MFKKKNKTNEKNTKWLKFVLSIAKDYKKPIALFVVLILLETALDFSTLFISGNVVNAITVSDYDSLLLNIILFFAVLIVQRILYFLDFFVFKIKVVCKAKIKLRERISDRVFAISSQSFTNAKTGDFINRISYGVENLFDSIWDILEVGIWSISGFLFVIYMFIQNALLGLVIAIIVILCLIILVKSTSIVEKKNKYNEHCTDEVISYVSEVVRSDKDIKSLNLDNELKKKSKEIFYRESKSFRDYTNFKSTSISTLHIIYRILLFVSILVATYLVQGELLTMTVLIYFLVNIDSLQGFVNELAKFATDKSLVKTMSQRLDEVFDTDIYKLEHFGNENFDGEFKGNVAFKNVCFAYDDSKDKNIINNMSFEIQSGKSVAFVGSSGSGKSTLISLLSKLYDATSGEVLLDNKNINTLSKDAIRCNLALVNQFPYIFDTTIKENLHLANANATEEDIWKALEMADLKDFVEQLPDKLDTVLGENGIKLSGGQKQRLAIARAFLKQSKVIIFDESTSSLDNFAQGVVQKSIESLHGKKTVIIVAHRLSTIKNVDTIFFVENGAIRNSGPFDYLFKNDEKFKALFMAENIEDNEVTQEN